MTPSIRPLTLSLLLGFLVTTLARADIEFVGILSLGSKTQFALTDTQSERTAWVALGDLFSEYKITAYDRATDTLTLSKAGSETRLHLRDDAKIKAARLELTGSITLGSQQEPMEIARATMLFDQENVFPLTDGLVYRITPTRLEDGTLEFSISMERTLGPNKVERVAAPRIRTLAGHPFKLVVGDVGFAFTPR
jgi:hypothetical protein